MRARGSTASPYRRASSSTRASRARGRSRNDRPMSRWSPSTTFPPTVLALRATDDALDEPIHPVQVLDGHALALREPQLALLVVQRTGELVERALDQSRLLARDRRLRLRGDLRPVGSKADHPVLEVAVVEVRLPRSVHRSLRLSQVVRTPVVDGRGEPLF